MIIVYVCTIFLLLIVCVENLRLRMQAGVKASPSTMVSSVRILALEVCFGVRNDVKMILTVLRCFPNVETLHIMVKPLMHLLAFICTICCMIHQYLLYLMCAD
jgi:hypothetical protein